MDLMTFIKAKGGLMKRLERPLYETIFQTYGGESLERKLQNFLATARAEKETIIRYLLTGKEYPSLADDMFGEEFEMLVDLSIEDIRGFVSFGGATVKYFLYPEQERLVVARINSEVNDLLKAIAERLRIPYVKEISFDEYYDLRYRNYGFTILDI